MSAKAWKLSARLPGDVFRAASAAQGAAADWDADVVLAGSEVSEADDVWLLELYYPRRPTAADRKAAAVLFAGDAPDFAAEALPDADWVTVSQAGMEPIRAGAFHVRTPDHPADPGSTDFVIPASQAFGTGQHATTAGCLAMLTHMHAHGVVARDVADIGTGTGLLAFAARALWPRTRVTASDIDPVCADVVLENAAMNRVPIGQLPSAVALTIAAGVDDPLIARRAPFDLVIANILARPLILLAPDFANVVAPHGSVVLAGLLTTQEAEVRRAYRAAGFRIAGRHVRGDWSILWLRRRAVWR